MKKLLFFAFLIAMLSVAGCKTTEANYREAYEIARQKQMDTGDSTVTSELLDGLKPKPMAFGSDTLQVRTEAVGFTAVGGTDASMMRKYCVVTGMFRQVFNARSMRQRLADAGYDSAFLVHNRMNQYYVVAAATDFAHEAALIVDTLKSDTAVVLRPPYPYVLRPAHLVR